MAIIAIRTSKARVRGLEPLWGSLEATLVFVFFGSLLMTAATISTVVLYMLISLINLRFGGHTKIEEYIPTFMYALMAIILVLSL